MEQTQRRQCGYGSRKLRNMIGNRRSGPMIDEIGDPTTGVMAVLEGAIAKRTMRYRRCDGLQARRKCTR